LATALSAGAHIVISGDRDVLDLAEYVGMHIVTTAQAVKMILG
jgi:predicted nucleic acid-binding protein